MVPSLPRDHSSDCVVFPLDRAGDLATIHTSSVQDADRFNLILIQEPIVQTGPWGSAERFPIVAKVFLNCAPFKIIRSVIQFVAINMVDVGARFVRSKEGFSNKPVYLKLLTLYAGAKVAVNGNTAFENTARAAQSA